MRESILIVDDDPGATGALEPMLRVHGFQARVAADAGAALREIERQRPDAILLDLHLPGVNGVAFLQSLRADERHASIPIALVTGDYLVEDGVVRAVQSLGAALHFKPLWEEDVLQIVAALLSTAIQSAGRCVERP
jgi:DNA-binding response OmpR family regulator